MGTVKSFKLVTGEEVVAEVVRELSGNQVLSEVTAYTSAVTSYIVKRPHVLQFQQVAPGQFGLALIPWTLSCPEIDKLELPASTVVATFAPSLNVEKQYLEQTSGIALSTPASTGMFQRN
jgi:hypothetical protein